MKYNIISHTHKQQLQPARLILWGECALLCGHACSSNCIWRTIALVQITKFHHKNKNMKLNWNHDENTSKMLKMQLVSCEAWIYLNREQDTWATSPWLCIEFPRCLLKILHLSLRLSSALSFSPHFALSIFSLLLLPDCLDQMTIMHGSFQTDSHKEAQNRNRREEPEGRRRERREEEEKRGQQRLRCRSEAVTSSSQAHSLRLEMMEPLMTLNLHDGAQSLPDRRLQRQWRL